ncbi:hypothetical protein [Blautia sp. MSJ-19]|uniref:hypothetical protein n=1 Tax=Blautia sp. MSJ-19 TaxID=2841517 RepID=UPI001C0F222A|nr:hypothetical protein [Blautia sp. MSJ-19]
MRLIDANKLKEVIHKLYSDDLEILEKIDEQPTAYDLDKVVKQIKVIKEKECTACTDEDCGYCKYFNDCKNGDMSDKLALDKAIEIVEGGGDECIAQDTDTNFEADTWDELKRGCPLMDFPEKDNGDYPANTFDAGHAEG